MIGKKGGSTVVSNTVTDTARTPPETGDASVTVGGYWHHIDLSTTAFANTDIDTIEFVLVAQTSSAMNYIAVDNFTYTNFGAASVKVSSTTAVSSSPNPSTYGQSVIFTATVTRSSGANTPSGVVTFMEGTNVLGTNTLAGSGASPTATYTNALLAVGAHTITANYAGDANFNASSGSAGTAQTVNKAAATLSFGSLSQAYNGAARSVTVTTTPASLANTVTYNGSANAPTNAGSYTVIATITNPNYTGSATNTLVVSAAAATLSFGSLSQSYNGAARSVTVTTTPASLANTVTYNGSANAPTNAGSYTVIATITNPNYTGSATNTLVVSPGAATLSFCSLSQTYNGAARSVTVATTPPGLANTVTYNGSANAPTNVGSYTVIGTITDTNYFGSATNTLIIGTASSSVAVTSSVNPSGYLGGVAFTATLPAEATGLVVFQSVAGSFSTNALSAGVATSLTITNLPRGTNVITVAYAGDGNHPASTNTFDQVVTNHPPVAQAYQLAYAAGLRLHIDLSQVATNWSDADGDPVSLTGINLVSTNGASVLTNSTQILYVNTAGVNDQIKYGISDGAGGTNTGVINIVVNPFVVGQQSPADLIVGVSQATATFYGVAGYNYVVERSTNLVAGSGWVNLSTNTAGADGVIKVTDNYLDLGAIKPASAYYRLLWQP